MIFTARIFNGDASLTIAAVDLGDARRQIDAWVREDDWMWADGVDHIDVAVEIFQGENTGQMVGPIEVRCVTVTRPRQVCMHHGCSAPATVIERGRATCREHMPYADVIATRSKVPHG